jgi:predicted permease
MLADLRFAVRQLMKSPGFTAVAVLSLALGIGANTALFSLADDILLRSLPVKNPHDLVLFRWLSGRPGMFNSLNGYSPRDPATGQTTSTSTSYFVFEQLRDQPGPFSDVFAFAELQQLNVGIDHRAEIASGQLVTGGYFAGLGVSTIRGRPLTGDDDRPDAPPAAVISHRYWQRRFGGEDTAIGKTIQVNNVAVTVVGVLPRDFIGTLQIGTMPDLTLPMTLDPRINGGRSSLTDSSYWWIQIMGRLRPGVSREAAQAQTEPVFVQAARDGWVAANVTTGPNPKLEDRLNPKLRLDSGAQGLMDSRRSYAQPMRILMCIVAVVLVLACVNVANLLLARSAGRAKEIAVRLSVGASRGRLVRQLLTESLLLASVGGAAGLVVAWWGRSALLQLRPIEGAGPLHLNVTVLAFAFGVAALTGVLFGLVPAWRATRFDLNSTLKSTSGGSTGGGGFSLRRALMVVQVALSVVLLVGAGLFLRTLHNLRTTDVGFNQENVLLFRLDASLSGYKLPDTAALFDRLLARLERIPGVTSAAFSRHPLLANSRRTSSIGVQNPKLPPGDRNTTIQIVDPRFLPTMQIPVLLGRNVGERDRETTTPVAVVNETFARTYFPGESPLGRTFTLRNRAIEIVGVARDARYYELRNAIPPTVYLPFRQELSAQANFAVRTVGQPHAIANAIRGAVRDIDSNLPIFELRTQEEQVMRLVGEERMFALLTAFFGALALVLTCIGLYGLLAHQVAARTREIGIRMALGAQLRAVISLVLTEGLCLAVIGLVVGLFAAFGLSQFVARLLFGVPPTDPVTMAGVAALLLAVATLACLLPARRAAKVDPMTALRAE